MHAWCARCNAVFLKRERTTRFCSRRCAREFPYYGAIPEMDDRLRAIAERCHRFVINCGTANGVGGSDLARYIGEEYRKLAPLEREFVHLWVSKRYDVAHVVQGDEFRFYPRRLAPEDATKVIDPAAP